MTNNRMSRALAGMGILSFVVCLIAGMVILARVNAGILEEMESAGNDAAARLILGMAGGCAALTAGICLWERLRYSEIYWENQRCRALVDADSSLIFTYDAKAKSVTWLGDAEHIFHAKKRKLTLEELAHPDDWPFMKQQLADLKWNREYSVNVRILDGEGQYRSCCCRMTAVRNALGKITYTMGIIQPQLNQLLF